jgi:O-antigen/teichoic acid export membrane protein
VNISRAIESGAVKSQAATPITAAGSFVMRFVRRTSTLAVIDQVVMSATTFLTGVLIGRFCPREVFGLYMLGFSIILFAYDFQLSLVGTPYTVHSPHLKHDELVEYTGSTIVHQGVVSAFVTFLLLLGWTAHKFGLGPPGLAPVMLTLMAVGWVIMAREIIRRICFARLLMGTVVVLDATVAALQLGGLLFLVRFHLLSATSAFWATGVACFVVVFAASVLGRHAWRINRGRIVSDFTAGWSFGKWVFASSLLWTFSMNIYPWLLTFFHGTASAGVWGACLGVVALANPILLGAQNYLGPRIATVYAGFGVGALRALLIRANAAFAVTMLVFSAGLLVVGERVAVLLYGHQYVGTGPTITVVGLSLVASTVSFSLSRALFAVRRAKVDFATNFVVLIVLAVVGIPLVRVWGPLGAAVGLLAAQVASAGIRWIVTVRVLRQLELGVS